MQQTINVNEVNLIYDSRTGLQYLYLLNVRFSSLHNELHL